MVDAVVSFAVEKLGNFLIQELGLPERLRNDVEWLKKELEFIQSFMKDMGQRQQLDHRVVTWISEIRNVADEAVEILDKFNRSVGKSRLLKCGFGYGIGKYACFCSKDSAHSIIKEIELLKSRVMDISRKRETYGIRNIKGVSEGPNNDLNSKSIIRSLRRATSHVDDEELFVGFEDVFQTLLSVLLQSEPRLSIVSIYGMGGLGKTTLARQLYSSAAVKSKFPYRAWVCVSQEYNTQDLLRSIIKSFKKGCSREELEMLDKMIEEDLERFLREYLQEHRYLVVVDDVWHREDWESLKRAFPDRKNGSRVMVTTRIKEVAERVDNRTFAKELRFLTPEESWDLFNKKLSHGEGHANWCSAAMLDQGMAMVNKCGGLPLAIIVLGGLLSHKRSLEEWLAVKHHIWGHLKNDSIEIKYILSLSYSDLSDELKLCFLYFGIFPEDHTIITEKLIWLWMAEDLIPPREGRTEDIARDFLIELHNRSLIQVAEHYRGITLGCRIHDLLRDLAVEKANQVNFFAIFDPRKQSAPVFHPRHAIHSQLDIYLSNGLINSSLRSLLFSNPDLESIDTTKLVSACKKFKHLRVLSLEGVHTNRNCYVSLPDAIGNLIRLRYLSLSYSFFRELPSSIGFLKNLQILQALLKDDYTTKFPLEISKLQNLRHLFSRPEGPFQFGNLTNLRTLRYIKYHQWVENDVSNLINLRELAIEEMYELKGKAYSLDSIGKLTSLEILSLHCLHTETFPELGPLASCQNLLKLKLKGRVEKLPPSDKLPQSLTMLTLSCSELENDPMPVLGKLPNLKNLQLASSYNGTRMACHVDAFSQLEYLYISSLENLKEWEVDEGAMPMLKGLEIVYCPLLNVPDRLKSIPATKDSSNNVSNEMLRQHYPFLYYW